MDATSGSFFEQQLDSYRNRLGNIKAEQALAWAKKVAEAEDPVEALREAVSAIATPLGLDFLREGIMHYAGVASAQIGKKLEGLDPKFKEIFKGRLDELVKLKKMSPEDRKKWIADEVQRRKQEALAKLKGKADEARTQAGDAASRAAGKAKAAVGLDNDDGGQRKPAQPANQGKGEVDEANQASAEGKDARQEASLEGSASNPSREPDREAPSISTADVDDKGINDRISKLTNLSDDDAFTEYGRIKGAIDEKAGDLTTVRKNAMGKASPEFKQPQTKEDLANELNVRNKIVNDALARQAKKRSRVTKYDEEGNAVTVRGRKIAQKAPQTAAAAEQEAQQDAVNRQQLRGPEPSIAPVTQPTLLDAFTGQPVKPEAKPEPKDEEPDVEPDPPAHAETLGGAQPPVEPFGVGLGPAPPSIVSGESYITQTERNPFSVVQASEQASRANLARLFPDAKLPDVDFTGAAARRVQPPAAPEVPSTLPTIAELEGKVPQISVRARAQALSEQLVPNTTKPQTAVRGGLGEVPALGLPKPAKAGVRPTRPNTISSSSEVTPEVRDTAPFISAETGSRIGTGLGRTAALAGVLAPLAGQGTAAQKGAAVGENIGVLTGSEAATRLAARAGAGELGIEGAGLVPGVIATLAGKGTPAQKAQGVGQQLGGAALQKGAGKLVNKLTGGSSAEEEGGAAAGRAAGTAAAEEGGAEGLEGLEAGLAASGAETGGLGFIAAGIVGIGAALASIFAPHKKAPPAPPPKLPNLSIPVAQQGLS